MAPRLALALCGAGLAALVGIALIPVSPPTPDLSRDAAAWLPASSPAAGPFRDIGWRELVPAGWDAAKTLREFQQGVRFIADFDPRAQDRLNGLREVWARAPANPGLDGAAVRLPGYVVPLERKAGGLAEFLLVPYFGACIHTPPPPANQVVRVVVPADAPDLHTMDAVQASGVLEIEHGDSELGASSWTMRAVRVEPFVPSRQR